MEGESSILVSKPAPDICASNPAVIAEDVISFADPSSASANIIAAQGGGYCLKSELPYILDESNTISTEPNQLDLSNSSLAGQTVPIVLMHHPQRPPGPSFMYPPPKVDEKYKTLSDCSSGGFSKANPRHGISTLPSRHCRHGKSTEVSNFDRMMLPRQFNDFEDHQGIHRFSFGLSHLSPEIDSSTGAFFGTFHGEGTFIQPGILGPPLDIPGTSSTASSSSGGTSSGTTMTTGSSSLSSSSRKNFPPISEKKKKKTVTIGNVFSTMDTFEPERTVEDLFDSGSAV